MSKISLSHGNACSSSDVTLGIIIWLDLHVCCVCGHAALLLDITKAWKYKLQGSYLDAEAPCIFIKNSHAAAEAPLLHNVMEPHKGKHMRPGLSLQIWLQRWIFCLSLFNKLKTSGLFFFIISWNACVFKNAQEFMRLFTRVDKNKSLVVIIADNKKMTSIRFF